MHCQEIDGSKRARWASPRAMFIFQDVSVPSILLGTSQNLLSGCGGTTPNEISFPFPIVDAEC